MSEFTDEDRERVEGVRLQAEIDAKHFRKIGHRLVAERKEQDDSALTRALAHINHLEAALEAADELAQGVICFGPLHGTELRDQANAYRSARAALKGEDDE